MTIGLAFNPPAKVTAQHDMTVFQHRVPGLSRPFITRHVRHHRRIAATPLGHKAGVKYGSEPAA